MPCKRFDVGLHGLLGIRLSVSGYYDFVEHQTRKDNVDILKVLNELDSSVDILQFGNKKDIILIEHF